MHRASPYDIKYSFIFLEPNAVGLESIRQWGETGKLKTIIGRKRNFRDMKAVQNACQMAFNEKGGVGESVKVFFDIRR